jgi:hypothetical protein
MTQPPPRRAVEARRCTTCGEVKGIADFYVNGGTCRRRECKACVYIGNTEYHRRCYEARRQVRAQHRAQREMPEASFEVEMEVVLSCWSDCVAEGRPAIDRMMLRLRAVAGLADVLVGHRIAALVSDYQAGRCSLDEAKRSVELLSERQLREVLG